jgi:hypothetical protein
MNGAPTGFWNCGPVSTDGGADADAQVDCMAAGGSCQSSGTICINAIATTSCGDPSMWICCADRND